MDNVIVLTQSCQYWDEIPIKKAIVKILKGKVTILAQTNKLLGYDYDGNEIFYPLVVQLRKFSGYKCKTKEVPFSHAAVFDRDNNICQYWHTTKVNDDGTTEKVEPFKYKCTKNDRTIDHVFPLSRGGENTFLNTVCACRQCNEKIKRNRTPEEAGLKLIRLPFIPERKLGEWIVKSFVFDKNKDSHKKLIEILPNLGY